MKLEAFIAPQKINNVKKVLLSDGNVNKIWKAIKMAKNLNCDTIPTNLTHGGVSIRPNNIANEFAKFFKNKVTTHVKNTKVCPNVYNG